VLLMATTADELREEVRRRYAESARAVTEGNPGDCGCGSGQTGHARTESVPRTFPRPSAHQLPFQLRVGLQVF
jgi:hypothetical protein